MALLFYMTYIGHKLDHLCLDPSMLMLKFQDETISESGDQENRAHGDVGCDQKSDLVIIRKSVGCWLDKSPYIWRVDGGTL